VATAHLVHVSPLPRNTGDVVTAYRKVLIPELNMGQLALLIRGHYLVDARPVTKVKGLPFFAEELEAEISGVMDE
jgi:2-oxoglutarate ferredoxin oxidoreductase subunit alpha